MRRNNNLYLVGPMGAGKTTIGRFLANALGRDFYDSDKEIEARTGVSIPVIFEYEGEEGFRKRESEALAELIKLQNIVLATGGGIVLRPENRARLAQNGFVVYLRCPVDKQILRTRKDTNRPLLNVPDPGKRLRELMAVRDPLYTSIADLIIDTGICSSRAATRKILKAYQPTQENSFDENRQH
ncbi:MAG: shikimate kinase [Methylothermaceae bacteria B42]|nr:MAG: shikimate kinase [Methylothermaceae bacteria B42]HHJ38156.1 shikimate kinase AroK [Methylothermaceae bacterium]